VSVSVRLSSHSAPAAPHAPGCPSGRLWRQAVRVQWVGRRTLLFGTLSWRCSRSRSTACPPLSFWAAVVAGGSGARGWFFRSWLVPCGSGDVLALLVFLVCFAALAALRAWRPCPALRGMCAHAACPGGVPHARSATRSFRMCMFNLALPLFMFMFSDLALLCFSKRLGPRSAGGAWGPHILAVVRSGVVQLHSHACGGVARNHS